MQNGKPKCSSRFGMAHFKSNFGISKQSIPFRLDTFQLDAFRLDVFQLDAFRLDAFQLDVFQIDVFQQLDLHVLGLNY